MKKLVLALGLSCILAAPAFAQYAPAPRSAPRTPVSRETLEERRAAMTRDVTGPALVLDGEKLRIDEADLRLFGVVPPQLSASYGPQARAALDASIGGGQMIACHIRDRDHDGRLLATCRSANGVDPALDLLRRGLAVAARGSIANTELAAPYVMAEQQAQSEKVGLWSAVVPAPVAAPAAAPAAASVAAAAPKTDAVLTKVPDVQPKIASAVMTPVKPAVNLVKQDAQSAEESAGVFARYQILIAGFLMLVTTLSILGALAFHRHKERIDEMKALAAALRGELSGARAVCLTRVKNIGSEAEDAASTWPRIRSTLYQAYVGKLGWLGAELARQIASIYGQASDYASYYHNLSDSDAPQGMPKRQALQTLAAHIDEVLPRLAGIEQTGLRSAPHVYAVTHGAQTERSQMPKPVVPMITHDASAGEPAAEASPASAAASVEEKLRNVVRSLRDRLADVRHPAPPVEEPMGDYTTIIEEDAERFSFASDEDDGVSSLNKIGRQ
jgi:endonuclease YncB( thermonuclease family)